MSEKESYDLYQLVSKRINEAKFSRGNYEMNGVCFNRKNGHLLSGQIKIELIKKDGSFQIIPFNEDESGLLFSFFKRRNVELRQKETLPELQELMEDGPDSNPESFEVVPKNNFKFIASEIVRSMTNYGLNEEQKKALQFRAMEIMATKIK